MAPAGALASVLPAAIANQAGQALPPHFSGLVVVIRGPQLAWMALAGAILFTGGLLYGQPGFERETVTTVVSVPTHTEVIEHTKTILATPTTTAYPASPLKSVVDRVSTMTADQARDWVAQIPAVRLWKKHGFDVPWLYTGVRDVVAFWHQRQWLGLVLYLSFVALATVVATRLVKWGAWAVLRLGQRVLHWLFHRPTPVPEPVAEESGLLADPLSNPPTLHLL